MMHTWHRTQLRLQVVFLLFGYFSRAVKVIALNAGFAPKRLRASLITLMFLGVAIGGGISPGAVSHLEFSRRELPVPIESSIIRRYRIHMRSDSNLVVDDTLGTKPNDGHWLA
jgi:hypothetical protein